MGDANNGGFSLAFNAAAKKQPRKLDLHDNGKSSKREFITGVGEDGGLEAAGGIAQTDDALKIIPKQENTYRSGPAKFKPSYIPEAADKIDDNGIDKFETAAHDTAVAQDNVTYGLNKRERNDTTTERPSSQGTAAPPQHHSEREADVLKSDLQDLPPEASLEAYDAMPVESFGEALMRGMGWIEGRAIGRGAKDEVTAKELVRRPHRLGLGAAPAPAPATHKKYIKPGETREGQDMVYVDASGTIKSSKPVDASLVDRRKMGVHPGKVMRIVAGRHSGLQCEVQVLEPKEEGRSERARVRLLPSHEVVSVRCSELEEAGGNGGGGSGRREENRGGQQQREGKEGKRRREGSPSAGKKKERKVEEEEEEQGKPWLVPNIRVKIVDKRVSKGRIYLKKGTIVDVKTPTVCDVFINDLKESVLDLKQSQLETVVPGTEGTTIMVVLGKHAGRRGRLLQRNTRTGLAAVQLGTDPEIYKLSLDDIAEYCGPTDTWDD